MTLIAGILARRKGSPLNPANCHELKKAISRYSGDKVITFEGESVFLCKVDIGAYGLPAFEVLPSGSVAMLVGEPLLSRDTGGISGGRDKDLELLHQSWDVGDWTLLSKTDGIFCAAHYVPSTETLTLITDKLGIRPLYYWTDSDHVIFGSALRIFEDLHFLPKKMDLRGVTEVVGFGYPLDKRTPYSNIKILTAAEILKVYASSIQSQRYWSWDRFPTIDLNEQGIEKLNDCFKDAVTKRLKRDTVTLSFLSGGLDSRCVVTALREQNTRVYTFNFGLSGAQDQVFAADFARVSETVHFEGTVPVTDPSWSTMVSRAWGTAKESVAPLPEHPRLFWSGDGGSVGLGHVYLSHRIITQMREGKVDAAIDTFLTEQRISIPERFLQPDVVTQIRNVLRIGIREELDAIRCEDRGRAFHLFLMLNDQRRHLMNHFEDIDLHRSELQLPFFDGKLIETIMTFPVEDCLNHGVYVEWLKKLPATTTAVPWQTYPGHATCPLPVREGIPYQWSVAKLYRDHRRAAKQKLVREVWSILTHDGFPSSIMRREFLLTAAFLSWVGIRDYSYALNAARIYARFWR